MSDEIYRFEYFDAGDYHRKFTGTFAASDWEVDDAIGKEFVVPDVVTGTLLREHVTKLRRTPEFVAKMIQSHKSRSLMGMNPLTYIVEVEETED
jgi:hypothetical protein